jgi:hypothetical protein
MVGNPGASATRLYAGDLRAHAFPDTAAARALATTLGLQSTLELIPPQPGVLAVATYELAGETVGAVRPLTCAIDRVEASDEFTRGCNRGELAALRWVQQHVGLFDPRPLSFRLSVLRPLSARGTPPQLVGGSAGLAAAISAATHWLGPEASAGRAIAATGEVDHAGRILPVGNVCEKALAVRREAPFVRLLIIPAGNQAEVAALDLPDLDIVAVESVSEALEHLFGRPEHPTLARIDPSQAARQALAYEVGKDHGRARAMADGVLRELAERDATSYEDQDAEVVARTVVAANLNHDGKAADARAQFEIVQRIRRNMSEKHREGVFSAQVRVRLAATAASAWIDLLDPGRAVSICEQIGETVKLVEQEAKVALYGSWARGLACLGYLDEAESLSDTQIDVPLTTNQKRQEPQAHCNRIGILIRRHLAGDSGALDRAFEHLATARAINDGLPDTEARSRNACFLDFWEVRLAAARGDAEKALELCPTAPVAPGRFPSLYRHRFVAEALVAAGRIDEALERLDAIVVAISDDCGPFERLILSTALARKACVLLDAGRPGWQEAADEFLRQLIEWGADSVAPLPTAGGSAAELRQSLEDILVRLPY